MDDELNVTYITLGGHVEVQKYRYLYFLTMLTVYVLIICFNGTIVGLIWTHRNLHEPMYVFIAALLLNSVLLSSAIYPKLLVDFLSEQQVISYKSCLVQFFMFYSLAGAEFPLLAAMAYDRYVSICKPLQYQSIMGRTTVSVLLVSSWLQASFIMSVPMTLSADMKLCSFTLNGIFCNNAIYNLYCVSSNVRSVYGVIGLVFTAVVPLLFILFTYTRILVISYGRGRNVRRKAAQTCLPHLMVLISFSCLCAFDVLIVRLGTNFPKTAHFILTLQMILINPLINPIIYGLKMNEIFKHLKKLLCRAKTI